MKKIIRTVCILLALSAVTVYAEETTEHAELLQKIVTDASSVEQSFISLDIPETEALEQYGYTMLQVMTPSRSSLVGDDYTLGPGDALRIYLWGDSVDFGAIQGSYEAEVDLDGGLYIAPAGRISAYGRSIRDVEIELTEKLNYRYSNISVEAAPARIRDFPVYVSGFVEKPGAVIVNGLWTAADTLGLAGGILPEGSLRNITVWRDGTAIDVDLYDLFITGKPIEVSMREGDIIYVPPISKVCAVSGKVKRPGIYEMAPGEKVEDLLDFAGGLQVKGAAFSSRIVRQAGTRVSVSETYSDIGEIMGYDLEDGDLLLLTPSNAYSSNIVNVAGAVHFPGMYDLEASQMLSGLLERAELRYDADRTFATIFRDDVQEDTGIVFSPEEILSGENDITLLPNDHIQFYTVEKKFTEEPVRITGLVEDPGVITYEKGMRLLDVIKNVSFTEDVSDLQIRVIRAEEVAEQIYVRNLLVKGDRSLDVLIEPGDMLAVVRNDESENQKGIHILGQVERPGVYTHQSGMRLSDIIAAAGGYTESAYPQALYLIRESVKDQQIEQIRRTISMTTSELDALEASVAVKSDLTAVEKNAIAAQIESQRSLLESSAADQGEMLGRISLTIPSTLEELVSSEENVNLIEGDSIYIPERSEYVNVVGNIDSAIALPWRSGKRVKEYLFDLGGLRARDYSISIIKYDGKVVKEDNLFFGWSTIESQTLQPGDVIIAVKKITVPVGTQLIEGLADVTDSVYKVVYSLNALDFFQ